MRQLFPVIIAAFTLTANSCRPVLVTSGGKASYAPLPDTAGFVLLGKTDSPTITGTETGEVSYEQTFTSVPWTNDEIVQYLKSSALKSGANLVKVTSYTPPSRHVLEKVEAKTYRVDNLRQYEKEIEWTANRRLTVDDFKNTADLMNAGDPAMQSNSVCEFYLQLSPGYSRKANFYTQSKFYCQASRINQQSNNAGELLVHEQGNFDLCEIYRRELERSLQAAKIGFWGQYAKSEYIYKEVYAAYVAKRAQYEAATGHGLDTAAQAVWTAKITGELKKTNSSPDSLFDVTIFSLKQRDSIAKGFRHIPDKALLYVFRRKQYGTPVLPRILFNPICLMITPYFLFINPDRYNVAYNDISTGQINGHEYIYRVLDPGNYTFAGGMNAMRVKRGEELTMPLMAGNIYYLELDTKSRWFWLSFSPVPQLKARSAKEGKKYLKKCRLSGRNNEGLFNMPVLKNPLK